MKLMLGLIIGLVFGWWWWQQPDKNDFDQKLELPPAEIIPEAKILTNEAGEQMHYDLVWTEGKEMVLERNYEQAKKLKDLKVERDCELWVNAGFFDVERKPLGLFINELGQAAPVRESRIFNGFILKTAQGWTIDKREPTKAEVAVQAGPMLWWQKQMETSLEKKEKKRRVVAVLTTEGRLGFAVFYNPEVMWGGPSLAATGEWLKELAQKEVFTIEASLNLDGGSASFFGHKGGVWLSEYEPVGSFFCIKARHE